MCGMSQGVHRMWMLLNVNSFNIDCSDDVKFYEKKKKKKKKDVEVCEGGEMHGMSRSLQVGSRDVVCRLCRRI